MKTEQELMDLIEKSKKKLFKLQSERIRYIRTRNKIPTYLKTEITEEYHYQLGLRTALGKEA